MLLVLKKMTRLIVPIQYYFYCFKISKKVERVNTHLYAKMKADKVQVYLGINGQLMISGQKSLWEMVVNESNKLGITDRDHQCC